MTFNRDEYARFVAILAAAGISSFATVPAVPGTKRAAVKWAGMKAGEHGYHDPERTLLRLLLTGHRSGGLCVIDIDDKPGARGLDAFARLEALHGTIPKTLSVRTPTGGLHLYVLPSRPLRTVQGVPAEGIDIRGEGGVVAVPGSYHKGGHYRIEAS